MDYCSIVVIDGTSNSVSKNIKLQWTSGSTTTYAKNPYSKFKFLPSSIDLFSDGNNHLLIGCIGEHEVFDGGIIAIDLSNDSLETEYILSEADLSMDIIDFVILSETKGYVITSKKVESDYTSSLYSFNPSDKSIILIKSNTGSFGQLSSLLYHSANNRLFVTDRTATNPGVRVFDTLTDTELNGGSPVYVGLPPADMVVVE